MGSLITTYFSAEYNSRIILKIGRHLMQLWRTFYRATLVIHGSQPSITGVDFSRAMDASHRKE